MPIHIVREATDVAGLVRQLLARRPSKAVAENAARALRAANPGLDLDRLEPGTVLVVPALPQARREGDPVVAAAADVVAAVVQALADTQAAATSGLELERAEREQAASVFSSPEVDEAARQDPDLRRRLEELRTALAEDEHRADQATAAVHAAAKGWHEELTELRRLVHGDE